MSVMLLVIVVVVIAVAFFVSQKPRRALAVLRGRSTKKPLSSPEQALRDDSLALQRNLRRTHYST